VTLEDLVEELVGEVRDEHDPEEEAVPPDADGRWTLAGNLRPDEAGELLGVVVPEHEDYDTLGGLVTLHLERLPVLGDTVTVPADAPPGSPGSDITLEVVALDGHRIETVRVRVEEHHEEDDDAADEVGREERREQPAAGAPVGAVDREQEGTR
jgi:CBS domain containing-hemolysin-like protein